MALYDPNEAPAEAKAGFTLAELLAWAKTKPADEPYDYCDSRSCALAQFGLATGRSYLAGKNGTSVLNAWRELRDAACGPGHDTFGLLVTRLEKALAQ